MLLWLRPWPAILHAQLFRSAQTQAPGAFPSVIQADMHGLPLCCRRAASERAVRCPGANNAGKVSWLSMESNRKLSCVMTSFERLHGNLSFCRARNELFKNSFFKRIDHPQAS